MPTSPYEQSIGTTAQRLEPVSSWLHQSGVVTKLWTYVQYTQADIYDILSHLWNMGFTECLQL